jgi:hypothetical protein
LTMLASVIILVDFGAGQAFTLSLLSMSILA